jgi:Mg2+-importing ATPase
MPVPRWVDPHEQVILGLRTPAQDFSIFGSINNDLSPIGANWFRVTFKKVVALMESPARFWSVPVDQLFDQLETSPVGLSGSVAQSRLSQFSATRLVARRRTSGAILFDQFKSPVIWLLFGSAFLSFALEDPTNGLIILFILVASGLLGYWQEWSANDAVARLLEGIETQTTVLRDGKPVEVRMDSIVPGDLIRLTAGSLIPGDCRLIDSKDLFVDEAALTGESYPVEKQTGMLATETPLSQRTNSLFLGTHVVSGMATAMAIQTGRNTEFGQVSSRLEHQAPETGFERGLRDFGNLLIRITLVFVSLAFFIKVFVLPSDQEFWFRLIESLKFALALAVGMTPQLLPAITNVVLAHGAKTMARSQVIVKKLLAIENLGGMNLLCSDKTGTLTAGVVHLHSTPDLSGYDSERVLRYASINAVMQSGFENPIDRAIRKHREFDLSSVRKLNEAPYDFQRKRLSVLVEEGASRLILTKGALGKILEVCSHVETSAGETGETATVGIETVGIETVGIETVRKQIDRLFHELSDQGYRVLGVARREVTMDRLSVEDEVNMTLIGLLVFFDPPKTGVLETVRELERLGVGLKIITGDNRAVTAAISRQVGLTQSRVMTGSEMATLSDAELTRQAVEVDLFAEVEPSQKERIILALKRAGNIVGFMGDGINDAPALHAADVGISVAGAVDVAREAAQIVLLRQDLSVLIDGVEAGRRTLANTLKYVFISISGNFGYMFSLTIAWLFMPFLPLQASQILLINLLADFPAMTLATDRVDPELIQSPRRWDLTLIFRFMLVFGLSGSIFDFLTFGILLYGYQANEVEFQTGWFIESALTGLILMLLVRTPRPCFQSRPGPLLTTTLLTIGAIVISLPFSPFNQALGFEAPHWSLLGLVLVISLFYGVAMEFTKRFFYRQPLSTQTSA